MAGNTKFMGFSPDEMVKLTRWGGEALVEVSEESVKALRYACYHGLPKKPPARVHVLSRMIKYDESMGKVILALSPEDASLITDVLDIGIKQSPTEVAIVASKEIRDAVQDHKEYTSTEGEPGVDNERSV